MKATRAEPSRIRRWKGQKRLWILLGGLIALLMVHVVAGLDPSFLAGGNSGRPLDRCLTEEAVLSFLDGKTVVSMLSSRAADGSFETITLRKDKISSLIIRSEDYSSILVIFNLEHDGLQFFAEGSFGFTDIDSPELHLHGWGQFIGRVVATHQDPAALSY